MHTQHCQIRKFFTTVDVYLLSELDKKGFKVTKSFKTLKFEGAWGRLRVSVCFLRQYTQQNIW